LAFVKFNNKKLSLLASGDDEEEDEGDEGEEKMPTCGDYIMHFLTLVWKVVFAIIPPSGEFGLF